ncbi:hypothetical protein DCAR_0521184 [Daucus carota subsp. sativus]|uniref:Integrase catalytic domain-containing protein n=1 Tax=Daucus carota subsp. sativus TaxID=79200 RepID=A0AAF0X7E0_DAUCS|nr:hypothetical protein DCAR_0521184 [Daucus carota subsp. sativus]
MVISWILGALSKSIGRSVIYCNSAHEMWKELDERYAVSNGAQLFGLHKEISEVHQGNSKIAEYFTKLKMLWDDVDALCMVPLCTCYCDCGAPQKNAAHVLQQRVIQFLMGLNENQNFSSQGHGQTKNFKKSNVICNYCKKPGHVVDKCYRLHGFPSDFKFTKTPNKFAAQVDSGPAQQSMVPQAGSTPEITPEVYSQMLSLLKTPPSSDSQTDPSYANFAVCNVDSVIDIPCLVCAKARQTRLPFPHSQIHSTVKFQLIHVDIWGPYKVPTYNKFKYFLTIVDDFSRATWTYLLTNKGSAFDFLKTFIIMAENHFKCPIQTVRSDNALELGLSHSATSFFHSKGIIHQTSCAYTPQQNGVVERKHKHLLETARALLFQSNLPIFFGETVFSLQHISSIAFL